ncbi:MAG: D-alanyl-D-alanine carboxypeptidase [Alphaproteobacteria bacterium]|nr:D-alanyl-D-alanine carboxypeptidase [Alphaproteobacteria bacterium]
MADRLYRLRRMAQLVCGVFLAGMGLAIAGALPAAAQIGSERYSSLILDARTGRMISSVNPDELRHPASLTKMMTLYMTFEALRDRRISLHQSVPMSAYAASMSPTKLGVPPGGRLTVEEAILGLVTRSANDAAAAMGELLGGTEDRFARVMTLRARALGMSQTVFRNASGLPDWDQVTTARDMATLARRLLADFPHEYRYFSTPSFRFRGHVFRNHNNLLDTYPGADGIKTGYIDASGYNLVSSAVRGNVRLIGVVIGAARGWERDLHMVALLDQGFEKLDVPIAPRVAGRVPMLVSAAVAAPTPQVVVQRPRPAARWAVQVGSFTTERAARQAAVAARRIADSGEAKVETVTVQRKQSFRAQVIGLTHAEVQETCGLLSRRKIPCVQIRPEAGQIASR